MPWIPPRSLIWVFLAIAVVALLVLAWVIWLFSRFATWVHELHLRELRQLEMRRGFEVKSTTGTTPVLREKENDHG
jgi:membrane protein YdbS with pleckstrin-like domain